MRQASVIARILQLSGRQRALLAEAGWRLALAAVVIRILPFRRSLRWSSGPVSGPPSPDAVSDMVRSVEVASARVPFRAVCFHQALALQAMLRRRGRDAKLHYGISNDRSGPLKAHVWLSLDGDILIGGEEAPRYQQMVVVP